MNTKKLILICFLLIVGTSFVSAAVPITIVSIGDNTLEIQTPLFSSLQQNEDLHLRFHVYNKSDGVLFNNSWVDCSYHIYRPNNTADGMNGDTVAGGDHCHKIDVDGGNFTELGNYFYYIHCNNTYRGGFAEGLFKVTPSGKDAPEAGESIVLVLSFATMFFISFLFLFISNSFKGNTAAATGSQEAKGNPAIRFIFIALSLIVGIITILYSAVSLMEVFWGFDNIIDSYSSFLYITLLILFMMFIFVLITLTIRSIELMRIKRGLG